MTAQDMPDGAVGLANEMTGVATQPRSELASVDRCEALVRRALARSSGNSGREATPRSGEVPTRPDEVVELRRQVADLQSDVDQMSAMIGQKFEELTLINQLSDRLRLDEDVATLCESISGQLLGCVAAATVAIELAGDEPCERAARVICRGSTWAEHRLLRMAEDAEAWSGEIGGEVAIVNSWPTGEWSPWRTLVVPIRRGEQTLGRIIAIRDQGADEFGTMEADLLRSMSMMLAVHLINCSQYRELESMFDGSIRSLVSALDAKDAYTSGHSSRVAEMAVKLAQRLGHDGQGLSRIRMAGMLHDIGKIGVDDRVLRKPGRLTDEEFDQIKRHPVLGHQILRGIRPFREILPAVLHHHEAWDGRGYPHGLEGEAIPRDAQILAVADSFDAMTSDRPYRRGMSMNSVIGIFRDGRNKQWNAEVVDALLSAPELLQPHGVDAERTFVPEVLPASAWSAVSFAGPKD